MEAYVVEPFGQAAANALVPDGARPMSYLSTTSAQTFYSARASAVAPPSRPLSTVADSRPMSITSFDSVYTYTNMGSEDIDGARRTGVVTFEDEEKAIRVPGACSVYLRCVPWSMYSR